MPNITRRTHIDCWRLDPVSWGGLPGDVRRCVHGKIQLRSETPVHSRMKGPGTDWWRTLSPIFDPILYRRAKKALA
jgi:hypothetical protein